MTQPGEVRIARAVLSVSDKTGIVDFARGLADLGVELISTGGTASAPWRPGSRCARSRTSRASRDHGRAREDAAPAALRRAARTARRPAAHAGRAREQDVDFVDLVRVRVNLYPFEATAARRGATEHEVIENIDIGGPTMIRAAAKNFGFWPSWSSRRATTRSCRSPGVRGRLALATRENLAVEAFNYTARYDTAISPGSPSTTTSRRSCSTRSRRSRTSPTARSAPARRLLPPSARMDVLSMVRQSAARSCRSTTCSTSARAAARRRVRPRAARSSSTTTRAAARSAGRRPRPTSAPSPWSAAVGVRRRDLPQPDGRRGGRGGARTSSSRSIAPCFTDEAVEILRASRTCGSSRTASAAGSTSPSATSSACSAACSCRTATWTSRTARRWRSSPSASPPSASGRDACLEGLQARALERFFAFCHEPRLGRQAPAR